MSEREPFKVRLEELLPAEEADPGRLAHARRRVAEKPDYFWGLVDQISSVQCLEIPGELIDNDGITYDDRYAKGEDYLLVTVAMRSLRIVLIRAFYCDGRGSRLRRYFNEKWSYKQGWHCSTPTLISSLDPDIFDAIIRWAKYEDAQSARLISRLIEQFQEAATNRTAESIRALSALLIGLLGDATKLIAPVAESLLPRVLAPGGKTARHIPLT